MDLENPTPATGGIIVVVIFMLLRREDLRDRFLFVWSEPATSIGRLLLCKMQDKRVARYLLSQLAVNAAYALPIGIGLWVIGVPNAPLGALWP